MSQPIKFIMYIYNSRPDRAGNCYYAFRFVQCSTGRSVEGKVGMAGGNINHMSLHWNVPNDWDRSISFSSSEEMPIRHFDSMVKDWAYAGSQPEEIAKFCRKGLKLAAKAERKEKSTTV